MLSEKELKTLDFIFRTSCKSFTIPYAWNKGRLSLKPNQHRLSNCIVWLLIVSTMTYKFIQLPSLVGNSNVTSSVVQLWGLVGTLGTFTCRLNTVLYKAELAQLLNQTLCINYIWGKSDQLLLYSLGCVLWIPRYIS